ncbi:MAG: hypothetical protein ABI548_27375 [Polyangiaceae bacterium]
MTSRIVPNSAQLGAQRPLCRLRGRTSAAITMLIIGLFVSVTDNVIRPYLSCCKPR